MPQKTGHAKDKGPEPRQEVHAEQRSLVREAKLVVTEVNGKTPKATLAQFDEHRKKLRASRFGTKRGGNTRQENSERLALSLPNALEKQGLPVELAPELTEVGIKFAPFLKNSLGHGHLSFTLAALIVDAASVGRRAQVFNPSEYRPNDVVSLGNLEKARQDTTEMLLALQEQGIPASVAEQLVEVAARQRASGKDPSSAFADVIAATWKLARADGGSEPSILKLRGRLPERAPEIYAERTDRSENAVDFLNRVWGPYIEAGVLYQDDFKRLGDAALVPAVRSYCHARNLCAHDHLPPPKKRRLELLAESAPAGSAAAEVAKARLRSRESMRRKRHNNP